MNGKAENTLQTRILSAVLLVPPVLAATWYGGWVFVLLCAIAGVLIGWEWSGLFCTQVQRRNIFVGWIGATVLFAAVLAHFNHVLLLPLLLVSFLAMLAIQYVREALVLPSFGVLYAAMPAAAMVLLRDDPQYGLWVILWLFAVVWGTDIAAYFTGRTFGGPKLAPRFSPNKTWSGLLGGVVAASAAGYAVSSVIGAGSPVLLALFSGVMAVVAQAGDILESSLKRRVGVKDSSQLIPGHGGVMDRLDGLVAVAVAAVIVGMLRGAATLGHGVLIW